jgi:polyphosphate glucokinase
MRSGGATSRKPARRRGPYTLAIDIGGSHLKASVLDRAGREIVRRVETKTPHPAPPKAVMAALVELTRALPRYDRVSIGFPGVVDAGRVITAPNLGTEAWHGFPLAARFRTRLRKPVRVLNDAEVQGFGVIAGTGLECVLTLGTGLGSAVYRDGELMPHLELGQHPIAKGATYDQYVGSAALARKGVRKWNRRVEKMIGIVRTLVNFDHLYLGGGDAARVDIALPSDVTTVSNEAGITGGARLWDRDLDPFFARPARKAFRVRRSKRSHDP